MHPKYRRRNGGHFVHGGDELTSEALHYGYWISAQQQHVSLAITVEHRVVADRTIDSLNDNGLYQELKRECAASNNNQQELINSGLMIIWMHSFMKTTTHCYPGNIIITLFFWKHTYVITKLLRSNVIQLLTLQAHEKSWKFKFYKIWVTERCHCYFQNTWIQTEPDHTKMAPGASFTNTVWQNKAPISIYIMFFMECSYSYLP